uniref:RNA-directed RNA polymerase C-terminal domain-containing protein n=1 Tax=Riboviria sp. TaxID=2585031 RepID=A0A8K1WQF0_9VIRU|nr:MAG: hypothetical protein 1 [Riboviria sp.]
MAERNLLREALRAEYQAVKWTIPDDFMSFEHFRRVVMDMDMSSSPGYPYQLSFATNGSFLGSRGDGTFDENILRQHWLTTLERIRNREVDPIKLFVKPEPHKVSKVEKKSWRLISSVSVMDQIIDHMLFDPMNKKMVDEYLSIVPQIGWAPVYLGWTNIPLCGVAMDKSGWDWTVRPWLCEEVLELRKALCQNLTAEWIDLAEWRYRALFESPMFVTSGGHFLRQLNPGVMKSGCVNTISDNSIMQDILNKVVELETGLTSTWMKTMGDDTYQSDPGDIPTYVECLRKYCLVKEVKNRAEFAGFEFQYNHIEPLYFGKHCWTLLHATPEVASDIATAYALLYHKSRRSRLVKSILRKLGYVPSDAWLDMIWDTEDE